MKILSRTLFVSILAATSFLTFSPVESVAQGRDRYHCDCYELQRRVTGLNNVLRYARISRNEEQIIREDISDGYYYLNQINSNTPYGEQARICSEGNQTVDVSWRRWQAWLAERRLDPGNRCEPRRLD